MNARRTTAAARVATVPAAKTTISLRRRGVLAVAGTAVVAAASLGVTATAYAKKGGDPTQDVRASVACGTGVLKLKAKAEDGGRTEVEAEVDSNRAGQDWTVTLTKDGATVWTGHRITAAPSGSFSVATILAAEATPSTPAPTTTTTPTGTTTTSATPEAGDDSSTSATPEAGDDSSTSATPEAGDDSGHHHASLRARSSKGGDDKPGDDKGGSTPRNGSHVIGVTATLDALTCSTDVTM
jgi:hypothetical protein